MIRTKTFAALTFPALTSAALAALSAPAFAQSAYDQCVSGCGDSAIACGGVGDGRDCSTPRSQCLADCQSYSREQSYRAPKYGAFAYSQKVLGMGTAYDWPDRASAENSAMNSCRQLSAQATDCQIVLWFYNNCGALASTEDGTYGTGYGPRKYIAEGYALQICKQYGGGDSCVIRKSVCTGI